MSSDLYLRLGGLRAVTDLIDEIVDRHAANPLLAPRLRHKDLPQLKALSHDFFIAMGTSRLVTGGTHLAQAGIRIDEAELDAVINDVVSAMQEQGMAAAEIQDLVELLRVRSTVIDDALDALEKCDVESPTRNEVLIVLRSMKGEVVRDVK